MRTLAQQLGSLLVAAVVLIPRFVETAESVCDGIESVPGTAITLELVVAGLSEPVQVAAPPGDTERLFIVQKSGRILLLRLADNSFAFSPFLDIQALVRIGSERGLLGLAFHPRHDENGYFYVHYTQRAAPVGTSVVSRFELTSNPDVADQNSEVRLLVLPQPASNHNAAHLAFGPNDGFLYISTGDGGNRCDSPQRAAQDPQSLLGKILRIDVDGGGVDGGLPYGIPPDNPFQGDADPADTIRDEIWAFGLRNPWRCAFDPATGDFYIGDVGQDVIEEISYQPASSQGGENYEWPQLEGTHDTSSTGSLSNCASSSIELGARVAPLFEYGQRGEFGGCTVIGGVVYRGCRMPDLHGTYFFADHCGSSARPDWVRGFNVAGAPGGLPDIQNLTESLAVGTPDEIVDNISSFGTDGRGEVYICELRGSNSFDRSGKIFRIVPLPAPPSSNFRRGDTNGDEELGLADAVTTLHGLFIAPQENSACEDARDADDDGQVLVTDAIFTLNFLFLGGPAPTAPFPDCGGDPTDGDALTCIEAPCP